MRDFLRWLFNSNKDNGYTVLYRQGNDLRVRYDDGSEGVITISDYASPLRVW